MMRFGVWRHVPVSGWKLAMLVLLAGALGALALPPVFFFPILPLSLGVLYGVASRASSHRQAALWGFVFGMGFHTAGLYWLTNAILTRIHDFWWILPFAAPGVACVIAPLMAVPAVLCRFVRPGWPRLLVFSGSWTLADMSRTLLFSGFPWNPLGSALELPGWVGDVLIQPGSIVGVHGIGLAVVLASLAIWQGRRAMMVVMCAVMGWCIFGVWHLHAVKSLEISNPYLVLVQGNVSEDDVLSRDDALKNFQSYVRLTSEGVATAREQVHGRPIVVVWPESAFPGLLDEDQLARHVMAEAAAGAPILAGSDRRAQGHWYNSLEAVSPDGEIEAIYDKSRLVPFGEYQPWILPFNILPAVLTPGPGLVTWDLPMIGRVGPMVCYEIIFSGSVVASGHRPNWLLTISNDAWYGNSAGPRQHLATGRMRAVEEGLPVVFANNRGISALYDFQGHEVRRTEWGKDQNMMCPIPPPGEKTFFSLFGNITVILFSLLSIIFAFLEMRIRKLFR